MRLTARNQNVRVMTVSTLRDHLDAIGHGECRFSVANVQRDRVLIRAEYTSSGKRRHASVTLPAYPTGSAEDAPANNLNVVLDPISFDGAQSCAELHVFAQHILADGTEAFGHNGSQGATGGSDVRVDPTVSYNPATQETFMFWTEEDSLQSVQGIFAQKFNPTGGLDWGASGLTIVPLGNDAQINPKSVQIGNGALGFWIDQQVNGNGTIEAVKLDTNGNFVCPEFPVSSATSMKAKLWAAIAPSGLSTASWQDYRTGNADIYIQNVNPDCTLGIENR